MYSMISNSHVGVTHVGVRKRSDSEEIVVFVTNEELNDEIELDLRERGDASLAIDVVGNETNVRRLVANILGGEIHPKEQFQQNGDSRGPSPQRRSDGRRTTVSSERERASINLLGGDSNRLLASLEDNRRK